VGTINQMIDMLSREKGIDSSIVTEALKDAMVVAARKQLKTLEPLVAEIEPGGIQIYSYKTVVEEVTDPIAELTLADAQAIQPGIEMGGQIRTHRPIDGGMGRIAASAAKQVMMQKTREAERETIYGEYAGRVGELINTVVKRIEIQDLVVDLGKTEGRMPRREQSRLDSYAVGDRIRVVIKSVEKQGKNSGVIVSRGAPELVMRLFEQEVPEIYDGTVMIKGCAREAGERTKIAVTSRDRDVDSVGACVGMKGMRVQSIIRELRGEKIDIIEFNEDAAYYAEKALSPAKISRVQILDAEDHHMEVIVDDSQLSLAIGKKGQNVRLAAKLLGWRIDIKSEEEKRQEWDDARAVLSTGTPLSTLLEFGLPEYVVEPLIAAGIGTVERVGEMTPEELEQIPTIGDDEVQHLSNAINSFYGQFAEYDANGESAPEAAGENQEATENSEGGGEAAAEGEESATESVAESVAESVEGSVEETDGPTASESGTIEKTEDTAS
jgi:transcription termination/antitermination protein NusA